MEAIPTTSAVARDNLYVASEVVRKLNDENAPIGIEHLTDSEVVIAANTLPAIAAFLDNCQGSIDFEGTASELRLLSVGCAAVVNLRNLGHLIRNYP